MSVPGATDTVKTSNPAPTNTGTVSSKQVKEFKEAVDRSTTSSTSSLPSQGTSNSNPIILAGRPPINMAPTGRQGVPLYQSQGTGSASAPQTAAPAKPGKPIDVAQMEVLNRRVQSFNVARSPVDHQQLRDAQQHFQRATDALKAGDYKKAEAELTALGFPLSEHLSSGAATSAILLGTRVQATKGGGWQMDDISWGKDGNQALNDMNGFAANAKMINRLATSPGGVSNPPTETQVTQYMRDFANPPKGTPQPTPQQVMQAASDITDGMIVHNSSAGRQDPVYNANLNPHAFYRDSAGNIHEFNSAAAAQKAATAALANKSPDAPVGGITLLNTHTPDQWSDVTSQGRPRAGRYIGDCESKTYVQTRLLTAAGFTSLGTVNVQPPGDIGHMLGVFKAPDGTTWVTSNEEFRQVNPRDAKAGVGQCPDDLARAREQRGIAIRAVEEALLPFVRRRAAEAAVYVKNRQQREADAGRLRGRRDPPRHLADIRIGPPVDIVMQIVEFADRREAGFQHLHVGKGRDRLGVVRRQAPKKAIHDLAPGPEAVMRRPAPLAKPRHAALECVAMQIRQAGDCKAGNMLRAVARGVGRHAGDCAVCNIHAYVRRPARGQKGVVEEIGFCRHSMSQRLVLLALLDFRLRGNERSVYLPPLAPPRKPVPRAVLKTSSIVFTQSHDNVRHHLA